MHPYSGDPLSWDRLISSLPNPHLLQTWEWAQVKARYGWDPLPFIWKSETGGQPEAAAMVLKRSIPIGGLAKKMCILYTPKGPLLQWGNENLRRRIWDDLQEFARRQGAIFFKQDPDVVLGTGFPGSPDDQGNITGENVLADLKRRGWIFSTDQIQFRNTVMVDVSPSEEDLLASMKQKSRYNIHLAEKKGVTVRAGTLSDLPLLYKLYAETSVRDGFVIRDEGYYQTVWETFMRSANDGLPFAEPLIAEVSGETVAAIFIFYFSQRAYYLYGMSRNTHREKMPNHLLQWEAIRRAKAQGCTQYDLWGAPDDFNENDPMWGVFRFKEGLGGKIIRTAGAWDFAPNPFLYKMYTKIIPGMLDVMRARGHARTRQSIAS